MNLYLNILVLAFSFFILARSADYFVDSAVNLAEILRLPKIFIGIVLVAFATTAPEFAVSVQSAYLGHPEIALGNALGSVICDDALAMALAAIISVTPIAVDKKYLLIAGPFLISIDLLSYVFSLDGKFSRAEGLILVIILFLYILYILKAEIKRRRSAAGNDADPPLEAGNQSVGKQVVVFLLALAVVIVSSRLVIWSSVNIAGIFGVPETIIGLSAIAVGTSLPEISTCISAAAKKEGGIIVGNIIGADILNVLWIIGVSAIVNPIIVEKKIIHFAFPWMIIIVSTMLICMRIKYRVGRPKGFILLGLYVIYVYMTLTLFY